MTDSGTARRRVAVLGGGITGLAAACTLARARQAGAPIEEFLIEASDRLGGVIRTEYVEGFVVEGGPDSFLAEKPEGAALCRELGLGDSLLPSNDLQRRTYILHRGRLVPLPDGLQLMVPTRLLPALATPLLPLGAKLAIMLKWVGDRSDEGASSSRSQKPATDECVANFVRRHFGSAMLENIADPLLAGIFGGDSEALSVRSALPRLYEMEQEYGSLIQGMRQARKRRARAHPSLEQAGDFAEDVGAGSKPAPPATPLFVTLRDGLEQLVNALGMRLDGSRLFLRQRVLSLERPPVGGGAGYRIHCGGGVSREADAIILALPAYECGRLLADFDSVLAESLNTIPYTSALTVALGYDASACGRLPAGFGFLVPRKDNRRMLACTFVHNKFSHRAPPGKYLLRCFLGGSRDSEVVNLSDDEIISTVRRDLGTILSISSAPLFHRIYRWPSSMPQYVVGHEERLRTIKARLANHPELFLAGNAYSGIGMSDCIRTGKAAAERALEVCCRS